MMRWDILNMLIREAGYVSYLEIGCEYNRCFDRVECPQKVGVDPWRGGTHRMTSDEYFSYLTKYSAFPSTFDLVFVDGLHEAPQVVRDVLNACAVLKPGGRIVLHDCLPANEQMQRLDADRLSDWTGDVWKAVESLRGCPALHLEAVFPDDWGVGVFSHRPAPIPEAWPVKDLTWADFERVRAGWPMVV